MVMLLSFIVLVILVFYLPGSDARLFSEDLGSQTDLVELERQHKIRDWKAQILIGTINENSAIFADSLAESYFSYTEYDSSAKYFEIAVELNPTPKRLDRWKMCKQILESQ